MRNVLAIARVVLVEMYRRKEFYVLFFLTIVICLIMGSISIFDDARVARYLEELCLLLIWVSSLIIAITMTARQIPAEQEQRTLLPLLAKPLSRTQLIFGKFLGCWVVSGLALLCFYSFFGALAASRDHSWPILSYLQAGLVHWAALGVVIALSLLGSLVFAAPSSNATVCFAVCAAIMCLARYLDHVALSLRGAARSIVYAIYYGIPNLQVPFEMRYLIVHDWRLVAWNFVFLESFYLLAYAGIFLVAACLVFRRKAVN